MRGGRYPGPFLKYTIPRRDVGHRKRPARQFMRLWDQNVMPNVFSTHSLPAREQFDAFRSWFDPVFDFVVEDPREFAATSEIWSLGNFALGIVEAPALRAIRTASLIRRNPVDDWVIVLGQQRACGEAAKGTEFDVPAGVAFVTTLGQEINSTRAADRRLQLYLPRDVFSDLAPVLDTVVGRPLDGAMGRLLAEFLQLLGRNVAALSRTDMPHLQDAVRGMVLACIAPSAEHYELAAAQIALTRREKIIRIVESNLKNRALDVAFVCRSAGISRSQLYRIMEENGGITHYIQKCRLRQAYIELSKFSNVDPIATIARSFAFNDPSSFSRSFKKEFGITPVEARSDIPPHPSTAVEGDGCGSAEDLPILHRILSQIRE